MRESKVNEYITLKLESKKTNVYVNGEFFKQCKFLMSNIPFEKISSFGKIRSVDEAAELMDIILESEGYESSKTVPEEEFYGHYSNMKVWVECDYDTRVLHSNLAFPLLKRLIDAGDFVAKKVFKGEILKRYLSGYRPVMKFLKQRGYLSYLSIEEVDTIIDKLNNLKIVDRELRFDNLKRVIERNKFDFSLPCPVLDPFLGETVDNKNLILKMQKLYNIARSRIVLTTYCLKHIRNYLSDSKINLLK